MNAKREPWGEAKVRKWLAAYRARRLANGEVPFLETGRMTRDEFQALDAERDAAEVRAAREAGG